MCQWERATLTDIRLPPHWRGIALRVQRSFARTSLATWRWCLLLVALATDSAADQVGPARHTDRMATSPPRLVAVVGADEFLVDRAVDDLLVAIRKLDPVVQRHDIDAAAGGAEGQFAAAASPSLFGEGALVVLDSFESASEALVGDLLAAVATAEPDGFWYVVLHPGGVKGKKVLDRTVAAGAKQVAAIAPKRGKALSDWLVGEFRRANRKVTSEGLEAITEAVGTDLRSLASACSQLASDVEADPISDVDVRRYFGGIAEVSGFQIADAVLGRTAIEALMSLRWAASADERRVGPATVAAVAGGLRSLVRYSGTARGASEADAAREAGVPPWKIRLLREQLRKWHPDQLARAVGLLADADAAVKGGLREGDQLTPAQKDLALERALLAIARGAPTD